MDEKWINRTLKWGWFALGASLIINVVIFLFTFVFSAPLALIIPENAWVLIKILDSMPQLFFIAGIILYIINIVLILYYVPMAIKYGKKKKSLIWTSVLACFVLLVTSPFVYFIVLILRGFSG